jgi:hypothetical protein
MEVMNNNNSFWLCFDGTKFGAFFVFVASEKYFCEKRKHFCSEKYNTMLFCLKESSLCQFFFFFFFLNRHRNFIFFFVKRIIFFSHY